MHSAGLALCQALCYREAVATRTCLRTAGVQDEDSRVAWNGARLDGEQVAGGAPCSAGVSGDRPKGDCLRHHRGARRMSGSTTASCDHEIDDYSTRGTIARARSLHVGPHDPQTRLKPAHDAFHGGIVVARI